MLLDRAGCREIRAAEPGLAAPGRIAAAALGPRSGAWAWFRPLPNIDRHSGTAIVPNVQPELEPPAMHPVAVVPNIQPELEPPAMHPVLRMRPKASDLERKREPFDIDY